MIRDGYLFVVVSVVNSKRAYPAHDYDIKCHQGKLISQYEVFYKESCISSNGGINSRCTQYLIMPAQVVYWKWNYIQNCYRIILLETCELCNQTFHRWYLDFIVEHPPHFRYSIFSLYSWFYCSHMSKYTHHKTIKPNSLIS